MADPPVGGRGGFYRSLRILNEGIRMPRYAPNKVPAAVKRRYFEWVQLVCWEGLMWSDVGCFCSGAG